jgi:diguanylate cyclase (GGDEF)-like protein
MKLERAKRGYEGITDEYEKLYAQNQQLKEENAVLGKKAEDIVILYDITKKICKSLEAQKVFQYFREEVTKYLDLKDCKFLRSEEDLASHKDYIVLPLKINKNTVGYLLADGVRPEDQNKFHILAQQFVLGIKRAFLYQKVQEMAITDSLTGISSRRYSLTRLNEEIARSQKFNYHFACLMIDVDNFKDYNDRYGHLVGDAILKEASRTIRESIRQIDSLGRYGGEEFLVTLTETDQKEAYLAAERIRQAIQDKLVKVYDEDLKIAVSIGVSVYPEDGQETQALIDKADQALYAAKNAGRNRVCIWSELK